MKLSNKRTLNDDLTHIDKMRDDSSFAIRRLYDFMLYSFYIILFPIQL